MWHAAGSDLYSSLLHKGTEFSMQNEEFPVLPGAQPLPQKRSWPHKQA